MRGYGGWMRSTPDTDPSQPELRRTYLRLLQYARPYWHLVALILVLSMLTAVMGVLPAQVIGLAVDEITGFGQLEATGEVWAAADEAASSSPSPIRIRPGRGETADGPLRRSDESASEPAGPRRLRPDLPITPAIRRIARCVSEEWLPTSNPVVTTAWVLVGVFLSLFIVSQVLGILRTITMAYVGQSLIFDMRSQLYRHVQKLSLRFFEDQPTGDVMSRVVNDVNSLEQVIVGPIVRLVTDVFRLAVVLTFCLTWDWQMTLLSLTAAPVLVFTTTYVGRILRRNFRELRRKVGELNALAQDNISGIRVIQGFAREDHEHVRFDGKSRENYLINLRLAKIFAVFRPWVELLNQAGMVVVLGVGSIKVLHGELNPGMFVVFLQYLPMLFGPITQFTRFYNQVQRALASCERVFEVLDMEPEIQSKPNAFRLDGLRGAVEFDGVDFEYRSGVEVLHGVSARVEPGEMLALVGPSGAGKSTFVNLIPRFYDPTRGRVLVDGRDLRDVDLASLRRHIGLVFQDPFLFNDTVANNIRYGLLGASDAQVIAAAEAANADQFVREMSDGYETELGERGVKLSGGQRQRIAIARAILADARILILDEATSSVDSETEYLIQEAVDNLVRNRTTFVIAHRLSTVQEASQILVLDEGHVVERGTHAELLALDGLYARLHRVQFHTGTPSPPPVPGPGSGHGENDEDEPSGLMNDDDNGLT